VSNNDLVVLALVALLVLALQGWQESADLAKETADKWEASFKEPEPPAELGDPRDPTGAEKEQYEKTLN